MPLSGRIEIQGSKNAALPVLAASLLYPMETVLHNCPEITDVEDTLEILQLLGCTVNREGTTVVINTKRVETDAVLRENAGKMRSSVLFLGALLGRFGEAHIAYPGGCVIGKRPVNLHIQGLRQMGVEISEDAEGIIGTGRPKGGKVILDFPSVGATENLLLAAAAAENMTVIEGCAKEPEIITLCEFLRSVGVGIEGAGTKTIIVSPVKEFRNSEFLIPGDRIVAGTYALAVCACGGDVWIYGVPKEDWNGQIQPLKLLGAAIEIREKAFHIKSSGKPGGISFLSTAPYPGFPTDLQSQIVAVLAGAEGKSCLREAIFEQRFKIVEELQKMGAAVRNTGDRVLIEGVDRLRGAHLQAKELRGGAALVTAALAAEGESIISGVEFIERGYEDVSRDLSSLGANMKLVAG